MPSTVPTHQARAFHHASDLPKDVWRTLMHNEAAANVILPFAKKALDFPRNSDHKQLWIALYDDAKNVQFVLSCTEGPLGDYPIFIVASKASVQITQEERCGKHLSDALLPLVRCLLEVVPPQRVFSVFSIARVTEVFAQLFEAEARAGGEHGIRAIEDPYYDTTFTFCTGNTLKSLDAVMASSRSWPKDIILTLRRAEMSDLDGVTTMFQAFSETSPPFVLDVAGAKLEARLLIHNEQVWVHVVKKEGQDPEIACLVATTRESDNVTAVTKVFTADHWRGHGCAARLLHRVCQDLLQKKQRVVLYVGNSDELAPARKVYHKIGFQGLDRSQGQQPKGVERWLEIGFTGTKLGHW